MPESSIRQLSHRRQFTFWIALPCRTYRYSASQRTSPAPGTWSPPSRPRVLYIPAVGERYLVKAVHMYVREGINPKHADRRISSRGWYLHTRHICPRYVPTRYGTRYEYSVPAYIEVRRVLSAYACLPADAACEEHRCELGREFGSAKASICCYGPAKGTAGANTRASSCGGRSSTGYARCLSGPTPSRSSGDVTARPTGSSRTGADVLRCSSRIPSAAKHAFERGRVGNTWKYGPGHGWTVVM